jgi:HAD superfamily hydrolase (TIGR01509 family)
VTTFDAVLLDFGHTLFTNKPARTCTAAFRQATGQAVDDVVFGALWEAVRERSRQPDELAKGRDLSADAHRRCWLELLAPLEQLAPGLAEFTYERESSPRGWEPYPDSREVLTELRRRQVPVAIVSDCGWDIRELFRAYELDELVGCFELSYEHGVCKPAPEMFIVACDHLGVAPATALMVGDSALTDGGAAAVGITTLLLPAGDRVMSPVLGRVLDLVH